MNTLPARCFLWFSFVAGPALLLGVAAPAEEKQAAKITYDDHVKPVLRQKCFACHNPDKKSGDLDLTNYTNLMAGGGSGAVIEAGSSDNSYLYMLVTHEGEPFMPPESPKLPDEMLETIRKWIDGGALENAGSAAQAAKKPKFDMTLQTAPSQRPEVVPMPGRLVLEPVLHTAAQTAVTALATSPWAPLVAVAGQKQVLLYHAQSLEMVGVLPFPEGVPRTLKFSRNGALLLAGGGIGGASGRVVVWNITNGQRVFEVGDELDTVLAADISSDQTLIALGGPQRVVRIYSTQSGQLLHELRKHTDWICSLEFSPDSVLLASGDRNGGLFVWEAWTGRDYLMLSGHTAAVTSVSWRADSNVLASGSEDGTLRLWEMENGGQLKSWKAHEGVASLEYARDGRLVSCGRDRTVRIWDPNGAQQRAFPAFGDLALRTTICDETNRVIGGDWTGVIRVWNAVDGAPVGELSANPPTLTQRLEAATQLLAAKQAEQQPLVQALQAVTAAADGIRTQLAAAQAGAKDTEPKVAAVTAKVGAAQQAIAQAKAEHEALLQAVATLEPGLALLTEASAKLQQVKDKLPNDAELADMATRLQAVSQARTAQLDANRKAAADKASVLGKATQDLAVAEKEVADTTAALTAMRVQSEKLGAELKVAEENMAKAKQAADAAAAVVADSQKQVERWQGELEFAKQPPAATSAPPSATP